jgi:hypothetical protein
MPANTQGDIERSTGSAATLPPAADWVTRLERAASAGTDWVLVTGYPGEYPAEGVVRIYLDALLWQAVDVPLDAILDARALGDGIGTVHVWVDRARWAGCAPWTRPQPRLAAEEPA